MRYVYPELARPSITNPGSFFFFFRGIQSKWCIANGMNGINTFIQQAYGKHSIQIQIMLIWLKEMQMDSHCINNNRSEDDVYIYIKILAVVFLQYIYCPSPPFYLSFSSSPSSC